MKDQIKVGDVWIGKQSMKEKTVLFVTDKTVLVEMDGREVTYYPRDLLLYHTLKKHEPTIKKLVAWLDENNDIIGLDFDDAKYTGCAKKELIIKDGSAYVDMSEV